MGLCLQVLVVPLLAGASGKADVKPLTYVSALMALAGVGLLVEKGGVIMPNSGDAWSFASAVFFGIQVGMGCCCEASGWHLPMLMAGCSRPLIIWGSCPEVLYHLNPSHALSVQAKGLAHNKGWGLHQ